MSTNSTTVFGVTVSKPGTILNMGNYSRGNRAAGTYSHAITYYNGWGETEIGTILTATYPAGASEYKFAVVPEHVTGFNVYRTTANGSNLYFLAKIKTSRGLDTIWFDNFADSSLDTSRSPPISSSACSVNDFLGCTRILETISKSVEETPAAGSTIDDATLLAKCVTHYVTGATGTSGVKMNHNFSLVGTEIEIINVGTNALMVYPHNNLDLINNFSRYIIPAASAATFKIFSINPIVWRVNKSIANFGPIESASDVAVNNPQNGDTFVYDASTQKWENQQPAAGSGGSGSNASGNNTGTGAGVYAGTNSGVLQFKSISGANTTTISSTGTDLTITGATGTSTGSGAPVYAGSSGNTMQFKSISVAGTLELTDNGNQIIIGGLNEYGYAAQNSNAAGWTGNLSLKTQVHGHVIIAGISGGTFTANGGTGAQSPLSNDNSWTGNIVPFSATTYPIGLQFNGANQTGFLQIKPNGSYVAWAICDAAGNPINPGASTYPNGTTFSIAPVTITWTTL